MAKRDLLKAKKIRMTSSTLSFLILRKNFDIIKTNSKIKLSIAMPDDHLRAVSLIFCIKFNLLQLKKLIATSYAGRLLLVTTSFFDIEGVKNETQKEPMKIVINELKDFNKDGAIDIADVEHLLRNDKNSLRLARKRDFRSHECVEIIKKLTLLLQIHHFIVS
jgi:hypothetical protein